MRMREETLQDALHSDEPAEQVRAVQIACRQRRIDLLPDLLVLLANQEIGYFVEECLPQFGAAIHPQLTALVRDPAAPLVARQSAAGLLALLGDTAAVPLLLEALEDPGVNQAYLQRLAGLAPGALAQKVTHILRAHRDEITITTDPRRAAYFAALIQAIGTAGRQVDVGDMLVELEQARDWRIQNAARATLARG